VGEVGTRVTNIVMLDDVVSDVELLIDIDMLSVVVCVLVNVDVVFLLVGVDVDLMSGDELDFVPVVCIVSEITIGVTDVWVTTVNSVSEVVDCITDVFSSVDDMDMLTVVDDTSSLVFDMTLISPFVDIDICDTVGRATRPSVPNGSTLTTVVTGLVVNSEVVDSNVSNPNVVIKLESVLVDNDELVIACSIANAWEVIDSGMFDMLLQVVDDITPVETELSLPVICVGDVCNVTIVEVSGTVSWTEKATGSVPLNLSVATDPIVDVTVLIDNNDLASVVCIVTNSSSVTIDVSVLVSWLVNRSNVGARDKSRIVDW
jgi:hypothetical protein